MVKTLVLVVAFGTALILALRLLLPLGIHRFLYFPERLTPEAAETARRGVPGTREVRLRAADGVSLHGWFIPRPATAPVCGAAIYLHGNAGNVTGRGRIGAALARTGLDVLLLDYRGYGLSEGKPEEEGLYRDADAAYRHVADSLRIPPERILLFGESLGSAVAVDLAARAPVGALVLVGAMPGTVPVARALYSWLPGFLLDWKRHRFDALSRIRRVQRPILFAHGTNDRVIPPRVARTLYESATGPKRWYEAAGFGHNDIYDDPGFWRAASRFVQETMPCAEAGRSTRPPGNAGDG